jgi:hypothetical protein
LRRRENLKPLGLLHDQRRDLEQRITAPRELDLPGERLDAVRGGDEVHVDIRESLGHRTRTTAVFVAPVPTGTTVIPRVTSALRPPAGTRPPALAPATGTAVAFGTTPAALAIVRALAAASLMPGVAVILRGLFGPARQEMQFQVEIRIRCGAHANDGRSDAASNEFAENEECAA